MDKEAKEKVKALQLIKEVESTDVAIKIYDLCKDKKEYKKIYNTCKGRVREFSKHVKTDNKFYLHESFKIGDNLFVTSIIRNYDPKSTNAFGVDHPMEVYFNIHDDNKNGINVSGSSYFGGCNESEANEFIHILKNGLSDLNFIKEEK